MSRARTLLALLIVAGLFVALVLPATAPAWLFWGALGASTASAAAWGWISQFAEPEDRQAPPPESPGRG